ncbi:STAS domain-containing protein [Paractinoplanes globisporus]|uniref:Anti-sigma factor antagonist n=1 Tax=Paractinoplanes globisporus TaxID=113565 RepID=A0ABW6W8L3_9ACTN|nr:STAS domain-containing protein [Actinoplanes globisporus]
MTSSPPWTAEITSDDGTRIVLLTGEIDFTAVEPLRALLIDELDKPDTVRVVADLAAVSFLDSAALGILVSAYHHAGEVGRRFVVGRVSRAVGRVLEISGLYDLLVSDDTETA